jgi:hypothetical protein
MLDLRYKKGFFIPDIPESGFFHPRKIYRRSNRAIPSAASPDNGISETAGIPPDACGTAAAKGAGTVGITEIASAFSAYRNTSPCSE